MASLLEKPVVTSQTYELYRPTLLNRDDTFSSNDDQSYESYLTEKHMQFTKHSSREQYPSSSLGKPTAKQRFNLSDLLSAGLSFTCLAAAIFAVASESISWHLGVQNYQLVVLGFLLSIMNICLNNIAPSLFIVIEARYGSSTLQNYEGLLRNEILRSNFSYFWRLVLSFMMILPLGLSVGYKVFQGGESVMTVDASTYTGNNSYYGMFAAPGLESLGKRTGISLFANSTLPFQIATSASTAEPDFPKRPQAYGFNVLLLNNKSAAILDAPQPNYVSMVQNLLVPGESWNLSASVLGTVASFNDSNTRDPVGYNKTLMEICKEAATSTGAYTGMGMFDGYDLSLLDWVSPGNQTIQYVGWTPRPPQGGWPSCKTFSSVAHMFSVTRHTCEGTWSITRGGIQLIDGSCDHTMLPPQKQLVITNNTLFLGLWYMPALVEFLGPFATTRSDSEWKVPYMATAVAAMLWSRITALSGAGNTVESNGTRAAFKPFLNGTGNSYEDMGLFYPVKDRVTYIRPTIKKAGLLYCILAIQPVLTLSMLLLKSLMFSTPVDKGFGLISILSGLRGSDLRSLNGAALSGELTRDVKLVIDPTQHGFEGTIEYRVEVNPVTHRKKRGLSPVVVYH